MASVPNSLTVKDALDHAQKYMGGDATTLGQDDLYDAVQAAYREVSYKRDWNYLHRFERVTTVADYSTGTITYDHTGGTYERELTLASGTWPTWADYGWVRIDGVEYKVEDRKSGTVMTLMEWANPGADVAAGTTYKIFRDSYRLTSEVKKCLAPTHADHNALVYVPMNEWQRLRKTTESSGTPIYWSIGPDLNDYGYWAMFLWPAPDSAKTIDLMAHMAMRPLLVTGEHADDYTGTVSISGATVTGTGTTFQTRHVGSIMRFGTTTVRPTGGMGRNRFVAESKIIARASATSLTLDTSPSGVASAALFIISDPVDIAESMMNLFLASLKKQVAIIQNRKDLPERVAMFREELIAAYEADSNAEAEWEAWPVDVTTLTKRRLVVF